MKVLGWIITIAISILTAAVLELNKNTLLGWLLFVLVFAGMAVISRKYMGGWSWWKKALSTAAYLAVCIGIVFITWPPIKRVPAADTANPPRTEVYTTASGLFRRAILESSTISSTEPPHSYRLFDEALISGKNLMERYNCSTLEELRKIPAQTLVGEQESQHHVTIDGYVLPDTPYTLRKQGVHNEKAVIHGYNAEESGPFILFSHANLSNYEEKVRSWAGEYADDILALYDPSTDEEADRHWAKIYGAIFFNYSHYCLNRLEQENGVPSWEYLFTKDNGRLGSWHSGEMAYTFGVIPADSKLYTEEDRKLSEKIHSYLVNFAKNGDPNGGDLSRFDQSPDTSKVMEFGVNTGMIDEPDLALYEVLDRMYGW